MQQALRQLEARFDGLLFYDNSTLHQVQLRAYSTDASVYQEQPRAVAIPASVAALRELILFAREQGTTLLPRAAGTSLAGQVVGNGIVVDVSKYFTRILEVNTREKWARVQQGVIRDELNHHLKPLGLMYGPETSTANRAMLGGMLGNNSCGLHSIVWGAARDHVLEVTALLSDGSEAVFRAGELPPTESPLSLKDRIYSGLYTLLQDPRNRELIRSRFPDP
ncbi:MAG TPA: FAD-binding oxidoreductase, partial [Lacibacter sp.]|nr:FAD-binding oxidoreductase [Lacibacter sp.]